MAAELPLKQRDSRSTTTSSKELYDIFFSDVLRTYHLHIHESTGPTGTGTPFGMITIGQRNIFFHAIMPTEITVKELEKISCIHLFDIYSFNIKEPKKIVFYLNSYYDVEPEYKKECKDLHQTLKDRNTTLFHLFDFMTDALSYDTIELIDGSRANLHGKEWNLRVLNNIFKEEGGTFYEKFGFKAMFPVGDFKGIRIPIHDERIRAYVRDRMKKPVESVTIRDIVNYLHESEGDAWDPEETAVIKFIIDSVDAHIKKTHYIDKINPAAYTKTIGPLQFSDYEILGNSINFFSIEESEPKDTPGGKRKTKRKKNKRKTRRLHKTKRF